MRIQTYVPQQSMKKEVAKDIRPIFNAPKLSEWVKIRTTNLAEHINREIKGVHKWFLFFHVINHVNA